MLKGSLLTTIGILGTLYCFFIYPFGLANASTVDLVVYAVITALFLGMAVVGMNIRTKYIAEQRRTKL